MNVLKFIKNETENLEESKREIFEENRSPKNKKFYEIKFGGK